LFFTVDTVVHSFIFVNRHHPQIDNKKGSSSTNIKLQQFIMASVAAAYGYSREPAKGGCGPPAANANNGAAGGRPSLADLKPKFRVSARHFVAHRLGEKLEEYYAGKLNAVVIVSNMCL